MNAKILGLITGVVMLSSCSSVYKSGQTPDDVYYSPNRQAAAASEEYVETNPRRDAYYDEGNYRDDRYLRMQISRGRMGYYGYDDFAMMDPWMYNNWRWNSWMVWNSPWNSPWNSMFYWNSFYNPYCRPVVVFPGKFPTGNWNSYTTSRPSSAFGMSSYLKTNSSNKNYNPKSMGYYGGSYNNSNSNNSGSRRASSFFNNNNSNYNNNSGSYDRPSRSYSPSSSGGSSSPSRSSGSSGGGGSRPVRNGGGGE
ncbi:hypothetical protein KJS94_03180 [Flavihumibacter rivuli]|uniref:hypothetical protein n=1 Tax=Flavihumibacter rivuli TaxID=2838156 RepID=UPI001BDF667F|nr:hypothetical protein [Flavihumibacter rivuli]ULQ57201.1 hypothetical protein KJS94_03180 [Flavihumibacter rivuli]